MIYSSLSARDAGNAPSSSLRDAGSSNFLTSAVGLFSKVLGLNAAPGSATQRSASDERAALLSAEPSVAPSGGHARSDPQGHRRYSRRSGSWPRGAWSSGAGTATGADVGNGSATGPAVAAEYDLESPLACGGGEACEKGAAEEGADGGDSKVEMQQLFTKISFRLLPLFFVMVVMCYVDRTSLAFAAIQLNADLGFAPAVYGMGSGLFFLGYSLFQIPSNLLLRRFGGPTWLAAIIAAWGLAASAFAAMTTAAHFYGLRLLLGATEAGAFPGMWYVLTTFFPGDQITFPFAVVEAGISLSHVLAAPMAAACLSLDGLGGLAGWRWLFLLEGLPTLVLAVVMYRLLPRSPDTADFLTPAERKALLRRIEVHDRSGHGVAVNDDRSDVSDLKCASGVAGGLGSGGIVKRAKARGWGEGPGGGGGNGSGSIAGAGGGGADGRANAGGGVATSSSSWGAVRMAVTNKYVWYMGAIKFVRDIASFGLIFWMPTIVNALLRDMRELELIAGKARGVGVGALGKRLLGAVVLPADNHGGTGTAAVLLTALPFALAAGVGMTLAHNSQRTGERFLHISLPYIFTGSILTMYAGAANRSPWLGFAALSLGVVGVYCGSGPCLAVVSELAAGPGLVVALPLYNSVGTLGGFLGPSLVGWLVQRAQGGSHGGAGAAAIHGGGFGVSAVVLGSALFLAGVMTLALGATLGRLHCCREGNGSKMAQSGSSAGAGTQLKVSAGSADREDGLGMPAAGVREASMQVQAAEGRWTGVGTGLGAGLRK